MSDLPSFDDSINAPPSGTNSPPQLIDPGSVPGHGHILVPPAHELASVSLGPVSSVRCVCLGGWVLFNERRIDPDTGSDESSSDSGGSYTPQSTSYPSGSLWLEIIGVSDSMANVVLHGTVSGMPYTLLSKKTLGTSASWDVEQPVIGADGQDWTQAQVPDIWPFATVFLGARRHRHAANDLVADYRH